MIGQRVKIRGKVAVVTGADGGIGTQFCRALARRGADLVMVSIDGDAVTRRAGEIAAEFGVRTWPLRLDLTSADSGAMLLAFLDARELDAYILVNNAGIFSFRPLLETPDKKLDAFVDLHVRAVVGLCRLFGERMVRNGGGYILNMSSMSCWMPMPGLAMYASTKAFLRVFSRSLHYELRESGVSVMVACPGGIATDLFGLPENLTRLALRLGAIARPDRFAEKAIGRLLKGRAQYINGLTNRLVIVFVASLPRRVRMMVKHRMLDKGIKS